MNIIRHKPDLADVVVPLARIIAEADLSWADKAQIAAAINRCCSHWREMEAERNYLNQQQASGQCAQQQGTEP